MSSLLKLAVVMPSLDEEESIAGMISKINTLTDSLQTDIIVVDSSTDKTPDIAKDMGAIVMPVEKQGHGAALRAGLDATDHDIIVTTDCDNTYPMEYIPALADMVGNGECDFISCNRMTPELKDQMPFSNRLANRLFAMLIRLLYGIKTHDVTTGMFCFSRKVNQTIHLETRLSVPIELIIQANQAGFHCREIDIPYYHRTGNVTLQKWKSGKAVLKCIFNYRFKLGFNPDEM